MTKVLVSIDEKLLARIDRTAKRQGLTRSAYIARLAERDIGARRGPVADPKVRRAMARLDALFAAHASEHFDSTEIIRQMRDERTEHLGRYLH